MLAYNMLSTSTTNLRTYANPSTTYRGFAGGLGRKGANRIVILETDGAPNTRAYASMGGSGSDSYYKVRIYNPANLGSRSNTEWPSSSGSYDDNEVYSVVSQITALDSASTPGYSTSRKPALVYAIGYGSLFDPSNKSSDQTDALTFLQTIQNKGNTSSNTDPN